MVSSICEKYGFFKWEILLGYPVISALFLRALGAEDVCTAPPQTSALSLRAAEEWERCICENQAFSILHQAQEGRQELIKKDGGEMLVSIVLDRPLDEAKALVEDPDRIISEITANT